MATYDIEFETTIYVTIPVEAASLAEARALADRMLTRHSIQSIDLSDDMPREASVRVDVKGWEFVEDVFDED